MSNHEEKLGDSKANKCGSEHMQEQTKTCKSKEMQKPRDAKLEECCPVAAAAAAAPAVSKRPIYSAAETFGSSTPN